MPATDALPASRRAVSLRLPVLAQLALKAVLAAFVVAALHFGQDILVPLALAGLLAFVLDPLVTRLQRLRMPRPLAVGGVVLGIVAALAVGAVQVGSQVAELGRDLPRYESTIHAKLRMLRKQLAAPGGRGSFTHLRDSVKQEIAATRKALEPAAPAAATTVQVVAEKPPLQAWRDELAPLAGPLLTAGLVIVLLIFMLLERGILRDRVLRLADGDLHRMTAALDEAATRVSRYLTMQVLVNAGHGLVLGLGLTWIGVPGAALWGVLAALLRFVPYLGPAAAAAFPLALAFAVDPGWQMLLWTLGLVLTLELLVNNFVEPWAYRASTGLSSLAVLLSAAFWTLLWGVVGLVLAIPLTVCLLVLGRHLAPLRFLDLLLRSEPVFDAPTRLYQRLLAGDVEDAFELAEQGVQEHGRAGFYGTVALPALAQLAADQARAEASAPSISCEHATVAARDMVQELSAGSPSPPRPDIVCIGLRGPTDALAANLVAHALRDAGSTAAAWPGGARLDETAAPDAPAPRIACLCACAPRHDASVRLAARRLRRRHAAVRILLLDVSGAGNTPDSAALGVDAVTTGLAQALPLMIEPGAGAPDDGVAAGAAAPARDGGPAPLGGPKLEALGAAP